MKCSEGCNVYILILHYLTPRLHWIYKNNSDLFYDSYIDNESDSVAIWRRNSKRPANRKNLHNIIIVVV